MDNKVMERLISSASREEAFRSLAQRISELIIKAQESKGFAKVLLSGGGTPMPVYEKLSDSSLDFSKIAFGLVDDRFVPVQDPASNEGIIRNIFKNQADFNLEPMVQNPQDYAQSIAQCHKTYLKFIHGDVILLGMGGDGHFASLFPNDKPSAEGLLAKEYGCLGTNAPSHPTKRISTNLAFIESIEHRILLITGKDKLDKLKASSTEGTPISYIVDKLTEIYYAP
jgi:6-phosphogluconolactonase